MAFVWAGLSVWSTNGVRVGGAISLINQWRSCGRGYQSGQPMADYFYIIAVGDHSHSGLELHTFKEISQ